MSLELHIWGPAFGLPSIDPDCLATVAYLSLAAPRSTWSLVITSPSALSHALPALRDSQSNHWVAAGFDSIVAYVRTNSSAASFVDLDAGLSPAEAADSVAYAAFLRAEAAPLVALSLYVSSANWAAATRPAYSRLLPFPLTWIEPPALRAAHTASAAHLGFSSLDTDRDDTHSSSRSETSLSAALHSFPDRIRNSINSTAAAGGRPPTQASRKLSSALTPEAKAQIRLDEAARDCLSVLADRKGCKRLLFGGEGEGQGGDRRSAALRPTSLDCLAFGYLALMVVPDMPRPFLRDALRRHFPDLAVFVADVRQTCFGAGGGDEAAPLPWRQQPEAPPRSAPSLWPLVALGRPARSLSPLWLRAFHGVLHSIPGLSGEWLVWLWRQVGVEGWEEEEEDDGEGGALAVRHRERLLTIGASVTGVALAVSLILGYRRLPPFGAPLVVYKRVPRTLLGLGAAGAMLNML